MRQQPLPNLSPLAPLAFAPLPLGSVRPRGWLRRQLRIQADGLSGHIDGFWPDLGPNSGWLGGSGEGWERGPYYLDGLVPLAYLLQDERLIAKARRWLDWTLDHQHEDGWLGPRQDPQSGSHAALDPWPLYPMLKALSQYHEASGDSRVIPAMGRFFSRLGALLEEQSLFSWGKFRWTDLALSVLWLYNRTGDPSLLGLAATLHEQGYDWGRHFRDFVYRGRTNEGFGLDTHVVNNAMGVKAPPVWFQLSYEQADRDGVFQALANLDLYHGQATGVFTGDEHLAGLDPSQGTELCAVVEYLFSLEQAIAVTGDPGLADRLERIAYNALPATFTPDMWAHQYDQQANQVLSSVAKRSWTNNGDHANTYGLAPNFGCCTANMHQGWPKFAASLWMATPAGGLAAVAYAPSEVTTQVEGQQVTVVEETDYPFGDVVRFHIESDSSVSLPLALRVPGWCEGATLEPEAGAPQPLAPGFHTVERTWRPGEAITLRLPMAVRSERRYHGAVALSRGPLVYALRLGEEWRQIGGELPHGDWEVHPTTPWNYGLLLDPEREDLGAQVESRPLGDCPFSPEGAPLSLRLRGRRLPGWGMVANSAGPLPESPERSTEPLEDLELIPYGCTNLRVTELPLLES